MLLPEIYELPLWTGWKEVLGDQNKNKHLAVEIVPQVVELVTPLYKEQVYQQIEVAGRTCYRSEDKINEQSAEQLIKGFIARGHEAMIEFGPSVHFKATTNIQVSHELVRHRIASYAQESSRYCGYFNEKFGNRVKILDPVSTGLFNKEIVEEPYAAIATEDEISAWLLKALNTATRWLSGVDQAAINYLEAGRDGWSAQQCAQFIPKATATAINFKMNFRELRHFVQLRYNKAAHPQMQALAKQVGEILMEKVPLLFEDIIPELKKNNK